MNSCMYSNCCWPPAAASQCMNWWCSDVAPPPYGRLPPPPLSGAPGQTKATLLPFPKTSPYYIITSCIAPITIGNHLPSFWDEGFGLGPITAFKRCWGSPYIEVWQVQWQLGRGYHTTTSRCWSKPIVPPSHILEVADARIRCCLDFGSGWTWLQVIIESGLAFEFRWDSALIDLRDDSRVFSMSWEECLGSELGGTMEFRMVDPCLSRIQKRWRWYYQFW